jgi:sugar transferase (PEP-CTERM/EpsH1 system associated)
MRILFLTSRFPYPPLRGDQVRAYHQLRVLGRQHEVTLVALARATPSSAALARIQALCRRVVVAPLGVRHIVGGLGRGMLGDRRPLQLLGYGAAGRRAVGRLLATEDFDVVHAQLLRTLGMVPANCALPLVVDFVDALSASYRRWRAVAAPWLRPVLAFEARRLARYEDAVAMRGGTIPVVVSEEERRALGRAGARTIVNPNGVDLEALAFVPDGGAPGAVVFVGNLGYAPNAEGIEWFVREAWPAVRRRVPTAALRIVGPRAGRRVIGLGRAPGVSLTGTVPDVHAMLRGAQVAIAPLRIGAGIQNKVLEAMATGTPVVATRRAVGGISVDPGTHCLLADTPTEFADAVANLLGDGTLRRRLAVAGRALVTARYSWERCVSALEAVYLDACGSRVSMARTDVDGAARSAESGSLERAIRIQ